MAHYANSYFGFGGVMSSGMGKYHGMQSFETFSNAKPILDAVSLVDLHIWYPPYSDQKLSLIKKVVG
jgi:aldehyde dehydrogenase (NAD+)